MNITATLYGRGPTRFRVCSRMRKGRASEQRAKRPQRRVCERRSSGSGGDFCLDLDRGRRETMGKTLGMFHQPLSTITTSELRLRGPALMKRKCTRGQHARITIKNTEQ